MAFGIKHMVMLVGAGVLFAYGSALSSKERADVISRNNLVDGQPEAYDSCISALHRRKLTHGGSNKDFCACFAKQATEYLKPGHKNLAARFLEQTLDKRDAGMGADVFVPASYEGLAVAPQQVALSVLMATNQCSEDVRTTCPQSDQTCVDRIKAKGRHAQK